MRKVEHGRPALVGQHCDSVSVLLASAVRGSRDRTGCRERFRSSRMARLHLRRGPRAGGGSMVASAHSPSGDSRSRSVAQPAGGGPQCARESLLVGAGQRMQLGGAPRHVSPRLAPERRCAVSWRVSGSSLIESAMPGSWLGELVGGPVSGVRWCHAVNGHRRVTRRGVPPGRASAGPRGAA